MSQNRRSRSTRMDVHDEPEYATDALPANLVDEHGGRRLDIAEVDPISPRGVEIKSGYTYLSDDIQSQIEADAYLIGSADPKWNIVWHFDGGPSAPLLKELNDRGIPWTIKDPNNLPSGYTP